MLKSDGTVWTSGDNYCGQLGDGTTISRSMPVQVSGLNGVIAVAAGYSYTMALKSDGTVWGWGNNANGLSGLGPNPGTTYYHTTPVQVAGLTNVVAIASGYAHIVALKSDGTVVAWGENWNAPLGDGTTTNRTSPTAVLGLTGVVAIAAGQYHTLAVKSDGTVWSWGFNAQGQLGNPTASWRETAPVQASDLTGVVAVRAGSSHSIGLKNDGTVWKWGLDGIIALTTPVQLEGLSGVAAIDAGTGHSIALKNDGTVWTWAANINGNDYGQLGDGSYIALTTPAQVLGHGTGAAGIMASHYSSAVRKSDGSVWSWGGQHYGQRGDGTYDWRAVPVQVGGMDNVVTGAAGPNHNAVVKSDGTIWTWGRNPFGGLGDGTTITRPTPGQVTGLSGILSTAVGYSHTFALKNDGTVWSWGYNGNGILGDGTTTDRLTPVQVPGLGSIVSISSRANHAVALRNDGAVFTWGANSFGQLGDGTTTSRITPAQVSGLQAIAVAAGQYHMAAVRNDGTVWTWGANFTGQLGDGTTTNRTIPVQVSGLTSIVSVAIGSYDHTVALKSDGTLWAWGANDRGELGDGTTIQRLTPVQVSGTSNIFLSATVGHKVSMAVKSDKTLWTWGFGDSGVGNTILGLLGDGSMVPRSVPTLVPTLSGTTGTSVGASPALAFRTDGTLWAWGRGDGFQLGFSNNAPALTAIRLVPSSLDTDQDGMPDAWELQHFGNLNQKGGEDPDGDGLTNIQEFGKGSNPLHANPDGDLFTDFADLYPNDYYNGLTPTLSIIGGNNQAANPDMFNAQPFDVAVWNPAGTAPLVNAPVTFNVQSGGGQLAESNIGSPPLSATLSLRTDVDGRARVFYKQPSTGGIPSQISVSAGVATPLIFQTQSSDLTAPTVSLTAPTTGATVSGASVTVSANASDNVGVVGVQFKLDGVNLGPEDTAAPYSISWDTTTVSNGSHSLTAVARDAASNSTTSAAVEVTVSNVVPGATPPTASPAQATVARGASVQVTLSGNDPAGLALTFALVSSPTLGTFTHVSTQGNSSVWTYTAGMTPGIDDFSFTTSNGTYTSSPARISIGVLPPPPVISGPTGTAGGVVLDAATKAPIAGVIIQVDGNAGGIVTDATGRFSIPADGFGNAPGKRVKLVYRAPGYIASYRAETIYPGVPVTVDPVFLKKIDAKETLIGSAGGVAANSTGDVVAEFPAGATTNTLPVHLTRYDFGRELPGSLPQSSAFTYAVDLAPDGATFNSPVTVKIANSLGFAPGTAIPVGVFNPATVRWEHESMAAVSADGVWVVFQVAHFSSRDVNFPLSRRAPSPSPRGKGNERNQTVPGEVQRDPGVSIADGGYETVLNLPSYRSLERTRGLQFVYNSVAGSGVRPHTVAAAQDISAEAPLAREFRLDIGGRNYQTTFAGEPGTEFGTYLGSFGADLKELPTGLYPYRETVTNLYQTTYATTPIFGGSPVANTGVPAREPARFSGASDGWLPWINERNSPFGAGWSLRGLSTVHKGADRTRLMVTDGAGGHTVFQKRSNYIRSSQSLDGNTVSPYRIRRDYAGGVLVPNHNRLLRIDAAQNVTVLLDLGSTRGIVDAVEAESGTIYFVVDTDPSPPGHPLIPSRGIYRLRPGSATPERVSQVTVGTPWLIELDNHGGIYVYIFFGVAEAPAAIWRYDDAGNRQLFQNLWK